MALTDKLTAIADAIRAKNGSADPLSLDEMAEAVNGLEVGGGFPNGTEWTTSTTIYMSVMHNANGLWVAGSPGNSSIGLYYSTDGKTWTQSNITDGRFYEIYNANGLWVAGGLDAYFYYSTGGKNWTKSDTAIAGAIRSILCANGLWVAGTESGLYYSTDGMTWTQSNVTSGVFYSVANANGLWVSGGYYSTDGKTWTQSNITKPSYIAYTKCANGIWVSASSANTGLYYSTDGMTWTRSNVTSGNPKGVCYGKGVWVAGTASGFSYSTDGMTWTQSNVTSGAAAGPCVCENGIFVIGGGGTTTAGLWYSTDGMTWTRSNITTNNSPKAYYADGIWVAGDSEGTYYSVAWELTV